MNSPKNSFFVLGTMCVDFLKSCYESLGVFAKALVGKKPEKIKKNSFIETLDFFLHKGPLGFWKRPTGIKIGRSIGNFIHYIFYKDESFKK